MAQAQKAQIFGNNDPAVSPHLKAWVKQGNVCVVGVIGEGTTKTLTANWESPFEGDSLGSKFAKVGGLIQLTSGRTSITTLMTHQVWSGNSPPAFNLVFKLYALANPEKEVENAIRELEKMASPEVIGGYGLKDYANMAKGFFSSDTPSGRAPQPVWLNIGRNVAIGNCIIKNMDVPLDKERTKEGRLIRADVTLQIEALTMKNRSEIDATYG